MLRLCSLFALIFICSLGSAAQAAEFSGAIRVIDGDTVDVGPVRVRLHGIDAPERDQPCTTLGGQNWSCGDWVTRQVQDRFAGLTATCRVMDTDRYGRTVARCFVQGRDVGRELVRDGIAYAYRKYADDYVHEEEAAARAERGIHGFVLQSPARYRVTRIKGRVAPDANCRIKGNIGHRNQRIYHMPGQAFYEQTGIRPERGERWFCSEAQARASGWRAARR